MRVRAFLLPLDQKAAKHREAEEDRAEKHNVKKAQMTIDLAGGYRRLNTGTGTRKVIEMQ